ncbi:hypothetical protein RQP46_002305 [Phenoliferia psychrophenolica]
MTLITQAGAQCDSDANCDNGSCLGGVCVGGLGTICGDDEACAGNAYCTNVGTEVIGICGGIGTLCEDGCSGGNALCASGNCDSETGTCAVSTVILTPSQNGRSRRSTVDLASRGSHCPAEQSTCAAPGGRSFECVDTTSNLEQCGGCAGLGGTDCTALPGVDAVGCRAGRCEVWACAVGFTWSAAAAECTPAMLML